MYLGEPKTPENEINVDLFHEILIWPFRILGPQPDKDHEKPEDKVKRYVAQLTATGKWKETGGVYELDTGVGKATKYAEFMYFYPFIREILYGKTLAVLERTDVSAVEVDYLQAKLKSIRRARLSVLRVNLYVTHFEVGILVVELKDEKLPLDDVLAIQDQFRRVYPPYWKETLAGHCPNRVQWYQQATAAGPESDYTSMATHLDFTRQTKKSPMAAHWAWMVEPLVAEEDEETVRNGTKDGKLYLEQLQDERMPLMCYLAMDDPQKVGKGDQVRLCFCDGPGDWVLPYASDFLKTFQERFCYDRFWQLEQEYMTSRIFCCGYNFTVMGKSDPEFFLDDKSGMLAHFRHHYLHLGIVAHLHRAVLLVFSDRLSEAMQQKNDITDFNRRVQEIQKDLAEFMSGVWFFSVSSHMQGQDLFQAWSDHLGNRRLFEDVMQEVQTVGEILGTNLNETRNKATLWLTQVATIGVALGVFIGFWGMSPNEVAKLFGTNPRLLWIVLGSILLALLGGVALAKWRKK